MGDIRHIEQLVESGVPLAALESNDMERVLTLFKQLSRESGRAVYRWAPEQGLRRLGLDHIAIPRTTRPRELLATIEASTHFGIYLVQDCQVLLQSHVHADTLKRIAASNRQPLRMIVLLGSSIQLPGTLVPYTARVRHALSRAV